MYNDPHASRSDAAVRFTLKVLPQIHRAFFAGGLDVETKNDASPVTEIDRDVERRLRELIRQAFPDDGILGEEHGEHVGTTGYRWILDPIDGTRPFIHGVPLFGTLVAVEQNGVPVVGVVATGAGDTCRVHEASLQHDEYVGGVFTADGKRVDEPLRVAEPKSLKQAVVCYTQLDLFLTDPFTERLLSRLVKRCKLVRGWGDCHGHMMVATGRADVMIDPMMSVWDAAALMPVVKASGGRFVDLEGNETHDGGSAMSFAPSVEEELLGLIHQVRAEVL